MNPQQNGELLHPAKAEGNESCPDCGPGMHVDEWCISCGEDIGHGTASGRCVACEADR